MKLKLRGLGYRIMNICYNLYSFFFNYTNFIYLHIPSNIYIKSYKKRLILLSPSKVLIKVLFSNILYLKKVGPYFKIG